MSSGLPRRFHPRLKGALALLAAVVTAAAGCSTNAGSGSEDPSPAASAEDPVEATEPSEPSEPGLRDELVAMLGQDQAERIGNAAVWHDRERAERLAEITDEYGWPTFSLVGEDGATAAWAIAQHADHDVDFQAQMLELMAVAVDAGEADPSQYAFLVDRVAVNSGGQQRYGSQAGCVDGKARAGDIEDPDDVDRRRAEVGLPPLADYLAELEELCAEDLP